jgi:3-oxoacyl-[acyl-carrier protein] reductase
MGSAGASPRPLLNWARVFGCDLCAAELAETAKAGVNTEVLDLTDRTVAAAWIAPIEQTTGDAVDVLVKTPAA